MLLRAANHGPVETIDRTLCLADGPPRGQLSRPFAYRQKAGLLSQFLRITYRLWAAQREIVQGNKAKSFAARWNFG